jgi:hypothetical protein
MGSPSIRDRLTALDWREIGRALDDVGYARTPPVLTEQECGALVALYSKEGRFRSRIDMERYRFGVGDYGYFAHPLPKLVQALRVHAYRKLAPIANTWAARLGEKRRFPPSLSAFLEHCHAHGQKRPTPLLLRYRTGGYNCLHQDLYGEVCFPLQLTGVLSRRGRDYTGAEFLLVEQRPRAQARGHAIALEQGELLILPSAERPVAGKRGYHRARMRHGVSPLASGSRYALGIIFHDARIIFHDAR